MSVKLASCLLTDHAPLPRPRLIRSYAHAFDRRRRGCRGVVSRVETGYVREYEFMAARDTSEQDRCCKEDKNASSAHSDSNSMSQTSVNITTITNFINVGQVVHVGGSHNTVIMSGNQVQVMQQDATSDTERHAHSSSPQSDGSTAHPATSSQHTSCSPSPSSSSGSCTAVAALQPSHVAYAAVTYAEGKCQEMACKKGPYISMCL